MNRSEPLDGVMLWPTYFDAQAQQDLLAMIRQSVRQSPLYVPAMPKTGKPMSVRMTNMGSLGWVTDKEGGYRYQSLHPVTGNPWPPIPEILLRLWRELSGYAHAPEACLINYYEPSAKMGMHQDRDENALEAPVLSVSLGDDCLFRVGNVSRGGKTRSLRLSSGDVLMLSGPGRLRHHGVDRLYPGTSTLLPRGGRINLTLRRVTKP